MKNISNNSRWNYLLLSFLFISLILFTWSFFNPIINPFSLLSYILLLIIYLLSEKFSQKQISYPEKAFSYFVIYWLIICLLLYQNKNVRITDRLLVLYFVLFFFVMFITIVQTIYFLKKSKMKSSIIIYIIAISSIIAILLTILPRLLTLKKS